MECIKKLHETVEILEILWAKCLNCLKNLMQIFVCSFRRIVSDISLILHFCCIFAAANMLPIVRDKLIIR